MILAAKAKGMRRCKTCYWHGCRRACLGPASCASLVLARVDLICAATSSIPSMLSDGASIKELDLLTQQLDKWPCKVWILQHGKPNRKHDVLHPHLPLFFQAQQVRVKIPTYHHTSVCQKLQEPANLARPESLQGMQLLKALWELLA